VGSSTSETKQQEEFRATDLVDNALIELLAKSMDEESNTENEVVVEHNPGSTNAVSQVDHP
jgi:hypothetical protein